MSLLTLLSGPTAAPLDVVRLSRTVRLTKYVRRPRGMARAAAALLVLAGVSANQDISVPVAGLTLAANAPTVSVTANQAIAVPVAGLSLDGYAPTVTNSANQSISVPVAGLALAGIAPTVQSVSDDGLLSLVRKRPPARHVSQTRRSVSWLGLTAPSGGQSISIPVAGLTLQAYAPTVAIGTPNNISVPVAGLTLQGYAPTVAVSQDLLIPPRWGAVTRHRVTPRKLPAHWLLTLAAPVNQAIAVPAAGLTLQAYAPTVTTGEGLPDVRRVVRVRPPGWRAGVQAADRSVIANPRTSRNVRA